LQWPCELLLSEGARYHGGSAGKATVTRKPPKNLPADAVLPRATRRFSQVMPNTRVKFVEQNGVLSIVELKAKDRPELMAELSNALFRERVQVVRFETKVSSRAMVGRLTIVEHDGAPIDAKRRLEVQAAILAALDGLANGHRAPN
jgi:UTP:GlnB (protein PII) uridylyltransferase